MLATKIILRVATDILSQVGNKINIKNSNRYFVTIMLATN